MEKLLRRIAIIAGVYYLWYFIIFTYVPDYNLVGSGFLMTVGILWWRSRRRLVPPSEAEAIAARFTGDRDRQMSTIDTRPL